MTATSTSAPVSKHGHAESRRAVVALAGDVMLGRLVAESIANRGYAHPWGNILPMRDRADILLVNLECALTLETERFQTDRKPVHFRAGPDVIKTLLVGNVSFAGMANNHSLEFG